MSNNIKTTITTKCFGDVELIVGNNWAEFLTTFNGQEVFVSIVDYFNYGDKLAFCNVISSSIETS